MRLLRTELCALTGEPLRRPEGFGMIWTLAVIPNRIADAHSMYMSALTQSMFLSHSRPALLHVAAW